MSIIENIKKQSVQARFDRHSSASLLVTLLSEVQMVGKNAGRETTDDEAIAVIKKFLKNNTDTMSRVTDDFIHIALSQENEILESFLPKQLTEEDLRVAIQDIIDILKTEQVSTNMGLVMKTVKELYGGRYDGAMASKLVKEML